jgi:hypothetical protein
MSSVSVAVATMAVTVRAAVELEYDDNRFRYHSRSP